VILLAGVVSAHRTATREMMPTRYGLEPGRGHRTKALQAIRRAAGATNVTELRRVAFAALSLPELYLERELPFPRKMYRHYQPTFPILLN